MFLHGLVCNFCAVQRETPQGQVILPSRRLEVMDIKKNGAGEENTRGEKESRVSFVLTVLSYAVTSRCLLRRLSQRTSL